MRILLVIMFFVSSIAVAKEFKDPTPSKVTCSSFRLKGKELVEVKSNVVCKVVPNKGNTKVSKGSL